MTRKLATTVLALGLLAWLVVALLPLPPVLVRGRGALIVEDARGGLLREPPGDDGLRADWVRLEDVPASALAAIVQAEDHLFAYHPGVDPWALVRASWLNLRHGRVVSGGSTLAMQLARMTYDLPRSVAGKLAQVVLAPVLLAKLGRAGVLEAYVNLAPFGRDVRGIASASRAYFGKPLRDLTVGEAVALACLPRAPSLYDAYRHAPALLRRRRHVLGLMAQRGAISRSTQREAAREPLHLVPFERTFRAPHASALARLEAIQSGAPYPTRIRTTLEPELSRTCQWACTHAVLDLAGKGATHCAVVAMRISSGEVLAMVGSPNFRSPLGGQVNAALALRQPGSALKPFVYALAFERGQGPASLIDDVPTSFPAPFGTWTPQNYDGRFHGTVTLREALANSYNIPAAKLASSVGVDRVLERLERAGIRSLEAGAARYGVGIALGDGEVTLFDLVTAYATLARGGRYLEPTLLKRVEQGRALVPARVRASRRVFSPEVSYWVGHVLQDNAARRASFGEASVLELPFATAVKTGTSSRYRDNWAVGYAGDLVVGVWVGRHDGAPMQGVSGVSGAAPAFRRIMLYALGKTAGSWPPPPSGIGKISVARRREGARFRRELRSSSAGPSGP